MAGQTGVYVLNVVDQDGVHNGLVFDEPTDNRAYPRILKIDNNTGATSYLAKSDGSEIPQYQSPDGDYSDLSVSGITWHYKQ